VFARLSPALLVLACCAALLAYDNVDRHVRAVALLMRWTNAPGPEALRSYGAHEIVREATYAVLPDRELDVDLYRPLGVTRVPPIVLVHGAHHRGMREARLQEFARALASAGFAVFTPQLDELTRHQVSDATVDALQHIARFAAKRSQHASAHVIGISFAGSLALLAAARESEPRAIGAVTAVGSYASLDRLGRWYAGERATFPDGTTLDMQPHPYGARVLFQAHADTVFGAQAEAVRKVLRVYLRDDLKQARQLAEQLPEPPRADVLTLVSDEHFPLSTRLKSLLDEHREALADVSPEGQLAGLKVPVLLVHGADDPIIASTETAWLAGEVPRHALRASLITAAIRHAELQEDPSLSELWELVQWATALLEVTERQPRAPMY
jgi:pimeloyl-ACP methyl ester carboxylesterase